MVYALFSFEPNQLPNAMFSRKKMKFALSKTLNRRTAYALIVRLYSTYYPKLFKLKTSIILQKKVTAGEETFFKFELRAAICFIWYKKILSELLFKNVEFVWRKPTLEHNYPSRYSKIGTINVLLESN